MKSYKKKKEELIYLKEINGLLMNAKEIEKHYFMNNNKKSENPEDKNDENIKTDNKKLLDKQMRGLKCILSDLENNYEFKSPYHDEINNEKNLKKIDKITQEVSNTIIELYSTKKFNLCYNLWRNYDFQMLIGISPERSFDILNYLNKLRDRYENRKNLINKINEMKKINKPESKKDSNYNNNIYQVNSNSNLNNISNYQNNSNISMNDIYNMKLSENEQLTKDLKRQINNIKRYQN